MQIPLSWLKELVDIDVPAEVLADRMTKAGIETTLTYIGVPQQHIPGIQMPPSERALRMRSMRKRVFEDDVEKWSNGFLDALTAHRQSDAK